MLSINNNFHEIEDALKTKGIKQVKNEMNVGENKLRRMLKAAGYEYDTSLKIWRYVVLDDAKDVRNMSFWAFEQTLEGNTHIIKSNTDVTKKKESNTNITIPKESNMDITDITETNENSNKNITRFTPAETAALKELAQMHISRATDSLPTTASAENVHDAIHALEADTTMRKTFVINETLVAQLDAFCNVHRIKKSDALAVAITDLLAKYQ